MNGPPLLATDTNIWIDLENGKILADVFLLPFQFLAVDLVRKEIYHAGWENLHELGLNFQSPGPTEVCDLIQLRKNTHKLSVADLAAFLLAKLLQAFFNPQLITGCRTIPPFPAIDGQLQPPPYGSSTLQSTPMQD